MSSICIRGAEIITPLEVLKTDVVIKDDRILELSDSGKLSDSGSKAVSDACAQQVMDGSGFYLTPGLIDLQVNGSKSCNLWADPGADQFVGLRKELLRAGVTSFLPTLITDELAHLKKNITFLADNGVTASRLELKGRPSIQSQPEHPLARVPGIHLEGPFLSPEKCGVHPPQWLQPLSIQVLEELVSPQVVLMTLAPELAGADSAIEFLLEHGVEVSLGHSNATFDQAQYAFTLGVSLMTHTYNALAPFHHRAPGAAVAALLNSKVICMVIADGLHVHPAALEVLLRCKYPSRTILVSDAAWEGTSHGELVGSSISVADAVKNIVSWNLATFAEAILMASYNPATAIGFEGEIGHIAPGKKADLLLWDKQTLELKSVIFDGRLVD